MDIIKQHQKTKSKGKNIFFVKQKMDIKCRVTVVWFYRTGIKEGKMTRMKLLRLLSGLTHQKLAQRIERSKYLPKVSRNLILYIERSREQVEREGGWSASQGQLSSIAKALDTDSDVLLENIERSNLRIVKKGKGNL